MVDKCSMKRCRNEPDLEYLGRLLCQRCYEDICDKEDKKFEM